MAKLSPQDPLHVLHLALEPAGGSGAVTMTVENLAALRQEDVRRLLGWSSVSQSGYALMAVVALGRSDLAVPSLLYFLLAYALGNMAAFGVVTELRGLADRSRYAGLSRASAFGPRALAAAVAMTARNLNLAS